MKRDNLRDPDKQRFLKAVQHVESEEIPLFECDPDIAVVNRIMEKKYSQALHSFELPIPDYVELNRIMGNDMIFFSHIWRLGRKEMRDTEGRIHYIDGTMKTRDSLEKIWYPDLNELERRLEELLSLIESTGFGVVCSTQSAPFVVATAMGYEDYWITAVDDPGFIHEFTRIIEEWCLRELEIYLKYPIDVFKIGSGFITKNGPMCSPVMLKELETAYLKEIAGPVKAKGLPLYYHIDGNVVSMLDEIIEMGVDVLNPIEPCDGMQDIYRIKETHGSRLALCGNIDINGVLLHGNPEDVERDVVEHINGLASGGGYIVSSSHDLHQAVPVENFVAMRDTVHRYRFRVNTT